MAKTENTTNLPATLDALGELYPALNPEVMETMQEALGGEPIAPRMLPHIKLPSGGGVTFEVPKGGGEVEPSKTIKGIILAYQVGRRFYANQDTTTNLPPDCQSVTGEFGIGKPGGQCSACPHSQWDTGKRGSGQACKQYGQLALLMEGMGLPYIVQVPPTSLKVMDSYRVAVLAQAIAPTWGVFTEFGLEKKSAATGEAYAVLVPKMLGLVPADSRATVKGMAAMYKKVLTMSEQSAPRGE